ncbi:hypothetical protein PIB30_087010, partial [Stylosanthes scabra]|nr:hypothetical protein [Stylosanthes scabra]
LCPFPSPPSLHHRRSSIAAASPSPPAPPSSISFLRSSKFDTSNRDVDAPSLLSSTTSSVAIPGHLPRCRPSSPLLRCLTVVRSSFIDLVHFTPSSTSSPSSPSLLVHHRLPAFLPSSPFLHRRRLTVSSPSCLLLVTSSVLSSPDISVVVDPCTWYLLLLL